MRAFTGKIEIASIRQHARALPGLLACSQARTCEQVLNLEPPRYFHLVGLGTRKSQR